MYTFKDVIGHDQETQYLQGVISSGKTAHAYIIAGPDGAGKNMLAGIFAAALVCESSGERPCGSCGACRKADSKNHPDIRYVTHEKPALISVDEIRQQVVEDMPVRPYYGGRKVYIIDDAQKMNAAAQNALLKSLEEPPAYAVVLLLTTAAESLLETVRSRCVRLELTPVRADLVEKYLMEHSQVPDYRARECSAFARGSIGRAMELAGSEDFDQIRLSALMVVTKVADMDVSQITAVVRDISEYKLRIRDFLDILSVWYRDVLYFKATRVADALVFKDQLGQIRKAASVSSYEGIQNILSAIESAEARLEANVNFDLTMELLLLTMKEN